MSFPPAFARKRGLSVRAAIAFFLLVLLAAKIDIGDAFGFFRRLDFQSAAAIFFVTFWIIFVSTAKWRLLLSSLGTRRGFWELYRFYVIGYFFGNFLPTNIGGDAVRVALTAHDRHARVPALVGVFMERLTGMLATVIIALVGLPIVLSRYDFVGGPFSVLIPVLVTAGALLAVVGFRPDRLSRWTPKGRLLSTIVGRIADASRLAYGFSERKEVLGRAMLLSFVFNVLAIANVYVVADALSLEVPFMTLALLVPLVLVISAIPLSLNGLGIAEGAYVLCLSAAGLTNSEALSIALLMRAKTLVVSLLGGALFLAHRHEYRAVLPLGPRKPNRSGRDLPPTRESGAGRRSPDVTHAQH